MHFNMEITYVHIRWFSEHEKYGETKGLWVMTDIHHRLMLANSGVVFVCNVTLKGRPVQICGWCVVTRVHGQTQPHLSGHILRVLKESLQRHDLEVLGSNKSCPMMSTLQMFPANTDRVSVSFYVVTTAGCFMASGLHRVPVMTLASSQPTKGVCEHRQHYHSNDDFVCIILTIIFFSVFFPSPSAGRPERNHSHLHR